MAPAHRIDGQSPGIDRRGHRQPRISRRPPPRRCAVLAPAGARIAFTGGTDCNDHARIWEALDKIRTKHPNMVLLHGGSLHGAERIATCWAENRKVANSSQIGRGAATPRPSSAPIACSRLCRLGATVFAGSGISDNLTDKPKKPGIPLWHFDGDGPA